jgi:hypothetical protein
MRAWLILCVSLALAGAGCSSEDASSGEPDAGRTRRPDAATRPPDARPPDAMRPPDAPPDAAPDAPPSGALGVRGTAIYQRRTPSVAGLSMATTPTPIRLVDLEVVDATDRSMVLGMAKTDAMGKYEIPLPMAMQGRMVVVRLLGRVKTATYQLDVVDSTSTNVLWAVSSMPTALAGATTIDFDVDATPGTGAAGVFNILEISRLGADFVVASLGGTLELLKIYWKPGNNREVGVSHFSPDTRTLHIMGGSAGMATTSDTDEFDDGVMAHEFAHFFQQQRSHTLNPGGQHGGEYLSPLFAWAEGSATFVGAAIRGEGNYIDTYGVGAGGGLFYNTNLESSIDEPVQGIGSEETVQAVLWDLVDGAPGMLPDADNDGVYVAPDALLRVIAAFDPIADFPSLALALEKVMTQPMGAPAAAALNLALIAPQNRRIRYPLTGEDQFPKALALPGMIMDTADARSNPPTVGGTVNSRNGYANARYYRLVVDAPRMVTIRLAITGAGTTADFTDLELSLRDNRNMVIAVADTGTPMEELTQMLMPGRYIIRVDAYRMGNAQKASYTLFVE